MCNIKILSGSCLVCNKSYYLVYVNGNTRIASGKNVHCTTVQESDRTGYQDDLMMGISFACEQTYSKLLREHKNPTKSFRSSASKVKKGKVFL